MIPGLALLDQHQGHDPVHDGHHQGGQPGRHDGVQGQDEAGRQRPQGPQADGPSPAEQPSALAGLLAFSVSSALASSSS